MSEEPTSTDIQQQQAPEASRRPRWGIITLIGVILAVIGAALVYLFHQPMYEASAWIRIDERRPYIAFESKDDSRRFIETQIGLIRSPSVLAPLVSQPEIARVPELQGRGDPLELLQQQIKVTQPKGSELLMISFRSSDAKAAARVCNAVVDGYYGSQDKEQRERVQALIDLLQGEKERRAPRLRELRERERTLAMHATGRDPFGGSPAPDSPSHSATMHSLAVLRARLTDAEVQRETLEARVRAVEEWTSKEQVHVPDGIVEERIEANPLVQQVRQFIDGKRFELFEAEMSSSGEDNKGLVNRLQEDIGKAESKLAEVRKELRAQTEMQIKKDLINERKDKLADLRLQLKSLRTREESLQARYESQLENVKQYSGETYDLVSVRDEHKRAKDVLDRIEDRIVQLRTEQPAPSGVKVGHRAQVPRFPVRNPLVGIILAASGGFCLPFIVLGLWIGLARLKAWSKMQ